MVRKEGKERIDRKLTSTKRRVLERERLGKRIAPEQVESVKRKAER